MTRENPARTLVLVSDPDAAGVWEGVLRDLAGERGVVPVPSTAAGARQAVDRRVDALCRRDASSGDHLRTSATCVIAVGDRAAHSAALSVLLGDRRPVLLAPGEAEPSRFGLSRRVSRRVPLRVVTPTHAAADVWRQADWSTVVIPPVLRPPSTPAPPSAPAASGYQPGETYESRLTLFCPGRPTPGSGHDRAIWAGVLLSELDPGCRTRFGEPGPSLGRLRRLLPTGREGVLDVGPADDTFVIVLLAASGATTNPLPALRAAASGRPIVATPTAWAREVLDGCGHCDVTWSADDTPAAIVRAVRHRRGRSSTGTRRTPPASDTRIGRSPAEAMAEWTRTLTDLGRYRRTERARDRLRQRGVG